jgi:Bacterial protein of unknown function (DUF937)
LSIHGSEERRMATNLISIVMQHLTPDMIGRLATSFGLDRNDAQQAVGATIPALLASFAGIASTPTGAERVASAAAQCEPGILDSLARTIGGTGQQALTDSGSGLMSTLLGGSLFNQLVNAIGGFTGLGAGTARSLISTLAPVVMAVLSRQQRSSGLDASGLGRLLGEQRDQFAAALPPGLAESLSGTGLLGAARERVQAGAAAAGARISSVGTAAYDTAADAGRAASDAAGGMAYQAQRAAASARSSTPWLYGLGALVLLAGLAWWLFGGTRPDVAVVPAAPEAPSGAAPANFTVGGVDLRAQLGTTVDNVRSVLQTVTDPASAQAALPKLQEAVTQLDQVGQLAGQLPADAKRALAGISGNAMPALRDMMNKVMEQPGVRDVLKPAADALQARFERLTQA